MKWAQLRHRGGSEAAARARASTAKRLLLVMITIVIAVIVLASVIVIVIVIVIAIVIVVVIIIIIIIIIIVTVIGIRSMYIQRGSRGRGQSECSARAAEVCTLALRPVSTPRVSKLEFVDPELPGNPLWT